MAKKQAPKAGKKVETFVHDEAKRKNIPTAEYSAMHRAPDEELRVAYERRNRDLDPQLMWRGKDEQDWSDLVVSAPPLYIQEKVHPKALIDDLLRQSREQQHDAGEIPIDLFSDFNGIPKGVDKTEFYQHDQNWSNRMILGDSLQVMASLAEREDLRGKVQCIYIDPPYGIRFNSNFQWSTTSRDVKDGNTSHITREPEQVRAFRDTWRNGIHSYLTYLRDRLTVARDLLADSGSVFVQIGDENVHLVRLLLDELFGTANFVAQITYRVKSPLSVSDLARTTDFILWYARSKDRMKFRQARAPKRLGEHPEFGLALLPDRTIIPRGQAETIDDQGTVRYYTAQNLGSSGYTPSCMFEVTANGRTFMHPRGKSWKTNREGMRRLARADRLEPLKTSLRWRYFFDDAPSEVITDVWIDTFSATDKVYVVQTADSVVERCLLMVTDPSDLVLDPTCGSGTTAWVAELWGRRWITIDTSRVALALARARIMGARYPFFILADSRDGQQKEAEITRTIPPDRPVQGDIRQGFVYDRVPHVTLRSIANNSEIDVIWDRWQAVLEPLRNELNAAVSELWEEWEIPKQPHQGWPESAKQAHSAWWKARMARQNDMDASIAANAENEFLYDKPYEEPRKVRVAGPFTVESLSPHRVLGVDENDELIDPVVEKRTGYHTGRSFASIILENLKIAGVQQARKGDKIEFTALVPWPGDLICADGRYVENDLERRAAIFIGPEFGTVTRPDLVQAAREAAEGGFQVLVACAFNFEAHATEFSNLGKVPVLKARMNADLHMADDLKKTDKANLFVIFGEPDIDVLPAAQGRIMVKVNGVDVFDPTTGEVRSDDADGIACWFIDTDYNEESFFVRHAYFLGADDPYSALKQSLRSELNEDAWSMLHSNASRPFDRPRSGRIAVKVINHLGDEVLKIFRV